MTSRSAITLLLIPMILLGLKFVHAESIQMKWDVDRNMRVDNIDIPFVEIPSGWFVMGVESGGEGGNENEALKHKVELTGFYMSKFEVSRSVYHFVLNEKTVREGAYLPAIVEWSEAMKFCEILSSKTSLAVTLPSEAQWEYACRAGTTSTFSFGDKITTTRANFSPNFSRFDSDDLRLLRYKHESAMGCYVSVFSYWPNQFGLHNMHGNAMEWCLDVYDPVFYSRATKKDPVCLRREDNPLYKPRVVRGGGYLSRSTECRSAYRGYLSTQSPEELKAGFRIVVLPHF